MLRLAHSDLCGIAYKLTAVVLKWSRARKRYERQGLLVEETALRRAEQERLDNAEGCARRRERELYPACPAG